jgi:hypothetical protein
MIASADRERTPVPRSGQSTLLVTSVLRDFSRGALALVPLVLVQPILDRIAVHVATSHPDLFARLETHTGKRFLIDPLDLPFVLLLRPDVRKPYLRAHRRHEHVQHDARIAGAFFNLLDMIEGTLDGGLELRTLDRTPFLAINGIQTLSYEYLNLIGSLDELRAMGVSRFRLSPHSCDMAKVASIFRSVLDRQVSVAEAAEQLQALKLDAPFSNGFYYGKPGHMWLPNSAGDDAQQRVPN